MRLHQFKGMDEQDRRLQRKAEMEKRSHEFNANVGWTKSKTHQILNLSR